MKVETNSLNRWVYSYKNSQKSVLRLFCFPYAGGGTSIYRSWFGQLPPEVEICAVQLPGRESRMLEPFFTNLFPLVETLETELKPLFDMPFAFFGHSMGGLIGFELSRLLKKNHQKGPLHLFVAGRGAPQIPSGEPPLYNLPDDELIKELKRLNGTPKEVLEHEELRELIFPILRADFTICDTYQFNPGPALDCPITVFGGQEDESVGLHRLEGWREQTTGNFILHILPGDHFFIHSSQGLLLQKLNMELKKIVTILKN